jgi:hypothetical protein
MSDERVVGVGGSLATTGFPLSIGSSLMSGVAAKVDLKKTFDLGA